MPDRGLGPSEARPRNVELLIEYSGGGFAGWQVQPNRRTVAGEVERSIAEITREQIRIVAASRTDAGVNALGQVASFKTSSDLPTHRLRRGINALLPDDVSVLRVRDVAEDFHARFSARGKHYRYRILNRFPKSPLERDRAWHLPTPLDVAAMQETAGHFVGEHDFSALATSSQDDGTPPRGSVRRLRDVRVTHEPLPAGPEPSGRLVVIDVVGDSFLYKMVRTIVGTLALVGQGKLRPADVAAVLRARQRKQAGPTAPPQGLFLVRVFYSERELDSPFARSLEGSLHEDHDHRPRHSGPGQRQGVRGAKGREARAPQ